jgi:UDP-N-acetylmuramoyl-L-alanine---L-glutamate ligase
LKQTWKVLPVRFDDLTDKRVVIWGAGREGRAASMELSRRAFPALIAVTDSTQVPDDLAGLTLRGNEALAALTAAQVVVKSPGIPRIDPHLIWLRSRGVEITSLTDLWLNENPSRVIGVTGTKGKSTTSALIHHLLNSCGVPSVLVGNVGTPVTDGDQPNTVAAVTEVSSYQAADLSVSPRLAVITCLYPEHLPWHGSFEQYVADKLNLIAHGPEKVVIPDDVRELEGRVRKLVGNKVATPSSIGLRVNSDSIEWSGHGHLLERELRIHGRHNLVNFMLAAMVVSEYVDDTRLILQASKSFHPLPHRLEVIPSADGRIWVDDSLATAPEAVVAALEAHGEQTVTLIAGGSDRGLSFAPLIEYLRLRQVPVTVLGIGPAGSRLANEANGLSVEVHDRFNAAMERVADLDSQVVLLSPGSPSFDEFANYEERSRAFRDVANANPAVGTGS